MPRISVIVPCYKVETYLPQCIESILAQGIGDMEVILVDDGSPDRSGEICEAYAAKDKRIRVLHKPNGGVSAARNDGLALATGDYVIFVDSDDLIPPKAYEKMLCQAEKTNADVVLGDVVSLSDDTEEYGQLFSHAFTVEDTNTITRLIWTIFYKNYCPCPASSGPAFGYGGPWNKLVRRDILLKNHIQFDLRVKGLFDDIIYSTYILANAKCISYLVEPVYIYRILPGSITQSFKKDMPEIAEAILSVFSEFMAQYGTKGEFDKPFAALVVRVLSYSLRRYYCHPENSISFFRRAAELRCVMTAPRYVAAAKNVDLSILMGGQRHLARLLRIKAAILTLLMYKVNHSGAT